jgi:replicative DNA helicase
VITSFVTFKDALLGAIDTANVAVASESSMCGLATGLYDLDRRLGGLQPSDLIVVAGRPSMGKTAFVTTIVTNVAKALVSTRVSKETNAGPVIAFFSLETRARRLASRILSEVAELPSDKLRQGMVCEADFKRLAEASDAIQELPLYIDDSPGITVADVAGRAHALRDTMGLALLVVDYLQLLGGAQRLGEGRVLEISEITAGLKTLAIELDVPVIAISQLSRAVEARQDKRPILTDLLGSGSIEQDADIVMFVFREEYYLERLKPQEGTIEFQDWMAKMQLVSGRAEVIIGKQRHGPIGTVQLQFDGNVTRFSDLARDQYMPERRE